MDASSHEITELLQAWRNGDKEALNRLIPLVYVELHHIARRFMTRQLPGHTLQATALINEAYIRLASKQGLDWQNRQHFFGVCAKIMRNILIDDYRRRREVPLDETRLLVSQRHIDLLALDEALSRLEAIDPQKSQIVEMRFFSGMTEDEVAEVLKIAPITVKRQWKRARGWLFRELSQR